MISVERQLPRNSRIIRLVRAAAMTPSLTTPWTAAFTNTDWSFKSAMCSDEGSDCLRRGSKCLTPSMMARVEAEPLFSTLIKTERRPSTRTSLRWGGEPSRTWATSPM